MHNQSRAAIWLSLVLVVLLISTACIRRDSTSAAPKTFSPTFQTIGGSFISTLRGQDSEIPGSNQTPDTSVLDFDTQNTSEINIDVSDFTVPTQSFSFAINREKHFVRVISADSGNSFEAPGDVKATLTVEVLDPQAIPAFNPDSSDLNSIVPTTFAIVYNENLIQVFETGDDQTRPKAAIASINLQEPPDANGQRIATRQAQISGAIITLSVEALDIARPADTQTIQSDRGLNVFGASGEDKQQRVIDLVGKTQSGRVNVNVRIRGSEDACPEPCKVASLSPNNENNTPPPEDPLQPDTNNQADPDPNEGDTPEASDPGEGTPSQGGSPPPDDTESDPPDDTLPPPPPPPKEIPVPEIPEGEQVVYERSLDGFDPNLDEIDIILIIDHSLSVALRDPDNKRLDAARAYLNAAVSGDRIGISHFRAEVESHPLIELRQAPSVPSSSQKRLIRQIEEITLTPRVGSKFKIALDEACERLADEGKHSRRAVIMLTNDVDTSFIQTRNAAQDCLVAINIPVFLFGIGDTDPKFLERIADLTKGHFRQVLDPSKLVCEVQGARSLIAGGAGSTCTNDNIVSGGTNTILVEVPAGQVKATFSISWTEGDEVFFDNIVTGSGQVIHPRVSVPNGSTTDRGATFNIFSINIPTDGLWTITLKKKTSTEFTNTDFVFGYSFVPITPGN